jgi:hypothetical protein
LDQQDQQAVPVMEEMEVIVQHLVYLLLEGKVGLQVLLMMAVMVDQTRTVLAQLEEQEV